MPMETTLFWNLKDWFKDIMNISYFILLISKMPFKLEIEVLKNLFSLSFSLEVYNLIIPISCISKVKGLIKQIAMVYVIGSKLSL